MSPWIIKFKSSYYVTSSLVCDLARSQGQNIESSFYTNTNPFISCDFTRLKAEDPFSYPLYYQAVTRIQETATFSYQQVNQLSAFNILRSFTLNNPENIYHHTAPCAVLLFGRSASPYYCCLHKSLTNVTAHPPRTTKISRPTFKTGNLGQDLSPNPNSVL